MWSAGCDLALYLGNGVAAVEVIGGPTRWFDGAGWEEAWQQAVAAVGGGASRRGSGIGDGTVTGNGNRNGNVVDIDRRLGGRRGAAARVWLSGALARPFVFTPPAGLGRWAELEACARSVWARQPVAGERAWAIAVEPWKGRGPALGVACDVAVLTVLNGSSRPLRVRSIRPWWAAAVEASRVQMPGARLLAARDTDVVTLVQADERRDWVSADVLVSATAAMADQVVARRRVSGDLAENDVVVFELGRGATEAWRAPWVVARQEAAKA